MKLAIMQPYFLPYIGYFSLIKNTDNFILLDSVQSIYHGWIERNRILKQNIGWLYIKVPLIKHSQKTLIKDLRIDNSQNWKQKILSQLEHYKKKAPFYFKVIKLINKLFEYEYNDIVSVNKKAIILILEYLGINKRVSIFSEMNLKIDIPKSPDEWALNICQSIGNISEYWNLAGGVSFFDKDKYEKLGISLKFHKVILKQYEQKRTIFEPGLSIIDVMMFNSKGEINRMLDNYDLI